MATIDFAQFRQQQIRSIENQLVIEKLNVSLKQEIEALKADSRKAPVDDYKSKYVALAKKTKDWLTKLRMELDQTKSLCRMQSSQITFLNTTISETVQQIA